MLVKMLDCKCCRAGFCLLITFLIVSGVYVLYNNDDINQTKTRSNIYHRKGKRGGDPSLVLVNKTEMVKSPVQSERFSLLSSVCEKYKRNPSQHEKYILEPSRQIRGKFTFEPKSKLVFCNIMKQGRESFTVSRRQGKTNIEVFTILMGEGSRISF